MGMEAPSKCTRAIRRTVHMCNIFGLQTHANHHHSAMQHVAELGKMALPLFVTIDAFTARRIFRDATCSQGQPIACS